MLTSAFLSPPRHPMIAFGTLTTPSLWFILALKRSNRSVDIVEPAGVVEPGAHEKTMTRLSSSSASTPSYWPLKPLVAFWNFCRQQSKKDTIYVFGVAARPRIIFSRGNSFSSLQTANVKLSCTPWPA